MDNGILGKVTNPLDILISLIMKALQNQADLRG
jgi:malate/lactate dehydrogenase